MCVVAWVGVASDGDTSKAWDGDDTTMFETTSQNYPWLSIDLGRSFRITKVYIQGGSDLALAPLQNVEVRVGGRRAESPYDATKPSADSLLFGNSPCNVFYGPQLIEGQWIEFDCGFKNGILGRYLSVQLHERFAKPRDRKSTRLNSSHSQQSRMPSSA